MLKINSINCLKTIYVFTILINLSVSNLKIKDDACFEKFQTINDKGDVTDTQIQVLPEDLELFYQDQTTLQENAQTKCQLSIGFRMESLVTLIKKSKNSKDSSKIEIGDMITTILPDSGISKELFQFEGNKKCSQAFAESTDSLENIIVSLKTKFGMKENQIKEFLNSFSIFWIIYDIPEFSFDKKSLIFKFWNWNKIKETVFFDLKTNLKTYDESKIINFKKVLNLNIKDQMHAIVSKLDKYCEGPGRLHNGS